MKLTSTQLRRIIVEEISNTSAERISELIKTFIVDIRNIDPAVNFSDIEGTIARMMRRPAKISLTQRQAAAKKGLATRKDNEARMARWVAADDARREAHRADVEAALDKYAGKNPTARAALKAAAQKIVSDTTDMSGSVDAAPIMDLVTAIEKAASRAKFR